MTMLFLKNRVTYCGMMCGCGGRCGWCGLCDMTSYVTTVSALLFLQNSVTFVWIV
jgi:hypothetical protein